VHSKHPTVVKQPLAKDSTPMMTAFMKQHACPDSRTEKITAALADVIIDNMLPLSIAELESLCRPF